ncbi:hypothetical protein TYRP_014223 [Tyrophagus putrescentiae]|nr:hypothetical protein TYRP_014223 [Tyrophagus putrescentiae]
MNKYESGRQWRLFYTTLIFFNNFAFGICINLFFATMVDLSFIYGTSINTFSQVNIAFCVGYCIGSLANLLYSRINRQLALALLVSLQAVALLLLPYYGHLPLLFAMMVLMNIGAGSWEASANVWLVEMWPVGNSAILQAQMFCYGLGSITAPLLASPFVRGTQTTTAGNVTITVEDRVQLLSVPFTIGGVLQAAVPCLLFAAYFVSPYRRKPEESATCAPVVMGGEEEKGKEIVSTKRVSSSSSSTRSSTRHRKAKLSLLGICFSTYIAAEFGFITLSPSMYQYMAIQLKAEQSARVTALLLTTYTFGRLATAFISLRLPSDVIIGYHFALQLSSLAFLYTFRHSLPMIYVGTATLGWGFSALYPAVFAFTEETIGLTNHACSLYAFLVGFTCLLTPLVLSQVFHTYPVVLMLISGAFITCSCTLFIVARTWILLDEKKVKLVENK